MTSITDQMNAAVAAFTRGDYGRARALAEGVSRQQPRNAAILQFLGVVSCQAGDAKTGSEYFRRAIAAGADTVDNRLNLAKALISLEAYDEAEKLCEGAMAADSPDLQRMHAEILKARGRADDALWAYEALTAQRPDQFENWNNLGTARLDRGDVEGALTALQKARELAPKSPVVHVNLSRTLAAMDRHEEACLMMEQAALLDPKDPKPLAELGRMLTAIDHPADALRALGAAAKLDSSDPRIFSAIGQAFTDLSELAKAEQAFRFALNIDPSSGYNFVDLGILLEKANRLDELEALLGHVRRAGAAGPEIDYLEALLLNRKGNTAEALERVRTIESRAIHPATVAQMTGQFEDRLGNVDAAYRAFEDMNRLMAETPLGIGMDRTAYRRGMDRLAAQTTAEWFATWPQVPPTAKLSPAFLVGFPRSGTTLLDTMLMGHSATKVMEELPIIEKIAGDIGDVSQISALTASDVAALRERYFAEAEKAVGSATGHLIIDKNPLSMIRLPLIHRLFPEARIILAMRHPCDVVLSCFMQNFKPTEAMSSFLDFDNASRTYDRIFAYWEQCRGIFPSDIHMLRYEDMIAEPEAELRPVLAFLGLDWEGGVLNHQDTAAARGHIRTPSYAQVTERIYDRARGRWERYRGYMDHILPVLAPWAERYGYGDILKRDQVTGSD